MVGMTRRLQPLSEVLDENETGLFASFDTQRSSARRLRKIVNEKYNFGAVLAAYIAIGVVAALAIRYLVLGSPHYSWIYPQKAPSAPASAPAPKAE
jgi:hypothetical protein